MGFGAQSFDVDHRGFTVPVWVSEQGIYKSTTDDYPSDWFLEGTRHSSYFPVPFFVSSRDFGLIADTDRPEPLPPVLRRPGRHPRRELGRHPHLPPLLRRPRP